MKTDTKSHICDEIAKTFYIYEPDEELEKVYRDCWFILDDCVAEIERRAYDGMDITLLSFGLDENSKVKHISFEEAAEKRLLDFNHLRRSLIPQHTKKFGYRENFITNMLADALKTAAVKPLMEKKEKDYKYGYMRETTELAEKAQKEHPGLKFTGLDEYLKVIFPKLEWVHDKTFGDGHRIRPDYLCKKAKLIVEFDGLQHYTDPRVIEKDRRNQDIYEDYGYRVIRIPFFVQMTRKVVLELFGVDVGKDLCDPELPSMGTEFHNTPAYFCVRGLGRMATEMSRFEQQLDVNLKHLIEEDNDKLTGASLMQWFCLESNRYLGR